MNTKKAVWIGRPEKLKTTLHSFEFEADGSNSVFFTIGEEGTIELSRSGTAGSAFMLLHSPSDFVIFRDCGIRISFSGIEAEIPRSIGNRMAMQKEGRKLMFMDGDETILELAKDAFSSSASFGIAAEGPGSVHIEVF